MCRLTLCRRRFCGLQCGLGGLQLAAELRIESERRQDVTQDEGAYDEYLASMLRGDPPDLEAIATAANNRAELQHARVYVRCDNQLSPEQFADTLGRIKAAGPVFLGCNCRSVVRDWAQHKPWCHGDSLRRALSDAQDEASDGPPLGDRTWVPVAEKPTPSEP